MINLIRKELKNNSMTENGAKGYKTSGYALLDLNYQVSSLREAPEEEIKLLFDAAFYENKKYALKWLFFARDIREGLGERRLFRICYKRLAELDTDSFIRNLENISEYGRWDDLVLMLGINKSIDAIIKTIIAGQLQKDLQGVIENEPISLLGKWLPSENASSKKTKMLAKKVRRLLDLTPRQYRVILSKLRKHLKVVEVQMCNKEWHEIDYERVPSMANLRYKEAFFKHDPERRMGYLQDVKDGKSKLNMKAANPVDIVSRYTNYRGFPESYDETMELAWKNLKDENISNTLVVADGSGSMTIPVSGNIRALDVANALAIYTSEHNNDIYRNKYITFSSRPQFVDFDENSSLQEKLMIAKKHNEMTNTNIEAVFDLILDIAVEYELPQEKMVKNILIISDMEFDRAQHGNLTKRLFDKIKKDYENNGYKLPKLIFWNVNSRTKTIPLIENDLGVVLVSGFSQNVLKMVMSNKYDPYEVLIETLDNERYDKIRV